MARGAEIGRFFGQCGGTLPWFYVIYFALRLGAVSENEIDGIETRMGSAMTDQPGSLPTGDTDSYGSPVEIPQQPIAPWQQRRIRLPVLLFVATCLSTWVSGGLVFSLALMTTLFAHEMGHYVQARRYGVPASLPYFIPMPLSPIGTMGAVIVMQPGLGNRRSLFDIAVSGPLAGLVPALLFSVIGLRWSEVVATHDQQFVMTLGASKC